MQKKQKIKAHKKDLEIYAFFFSRDPSRPGDIHYLLPGLADRLAQGYTAQKTA